MSDEQFDIRAHLNWRIAICYHPMYMLVDEDRGVPEIAERKPPWAAATVGEYMERVSRNLASLEKDPDLKLNYEWASNSLEDLAVRFPDIYERMKAAHARGQLDFVGGEYSLAHTMAHGSESAWRQLQYGLAIMERLFGKRTTTHAHQENHLHSQLPQLLRRFGYRYLVLPSFPWAIEFTSSSLRLSGDERGTYLRRGHEMIRAEAPDGTTIPAYFATNVRQTNWRDEMMKDLWGCPPIWIDFPDLEEYHNPNEMALPVLLEDEIDARMSEAPPEANARLDAYYAYAAEGIWAEAHLRASKRAEAAAIAAESIRAMAGLTGRAIEAPRLDDIWKTILKYQDHDATWIEVTDLRQKAIDQFEQCVVESERVIRSVTKQMISSTGGASAVDEAPGAASAVDDARATAVDTGTADGTAADTETADTTAGDAAAVNATNNDTETTESAAGRGRSPLLADERVTVFNTIPVARRALIESEPDMVPSGDDFQLHDGTAIGFVDLPSFGYRSFSRGRNPSPSVREQVPDRINARHYEVRLSPEGLIESMHGDEREAVVADGRYLGGEIRAVADEKWVDNRSLVSSFWRGPVCSILEREGTIGGVPLHERYLFFLDEPLVKVRLRFEFNGNQIGDFHITETKLNVYYPTGGDFGHHDVPFGYSSAGDRDQVFALNWFHCGGLTYVNTGTATHWLRDGVIGNLIGWGGLEWTNRIHYNHWMKLCGDYDLRLYGTQVVEYFLIPSGDFDDTAIFRATESIAAATPITRGSADGSYLALTGSGAAVTGVYRHGETTRIRGYQMPGSGGPLADWHIFDLDLDEAVRVGILELNR